IIIKLFGIRDGQDVDLGAESQKVRLEGGVGKGLLGEGCSDLGAVEARPPRSRWDRRRRAILGKRVYGQSELQTIVFRELDEVGDILSRGQFVPIHFKSGMAAYLSCLLKVLDVILS